MMHINDVEIRWSRTESANYVRAGTCKLLCHASDGKPEHDLQIVSDNKEQARFNIVLTDTEAESFFDFVETIIKDRINAADFGRNASD